jgi:hypothetical protein
VYKLYLKEKKRTKNKKAERKKEGRYVTEGWVPFMFCIREISGSNLGPEMDYPGRGFSSVPPGLYLQLGYGLLYIISSSLLTNRGHAVA